MGQVWLFFQEGFFHIVSLDSIDHLFFLLALVAIYTIKDWRKLLIMATAFTIAHAIALLITIFNLVTIANNVIEWLIALTIFYTCIANLFLQHFQSTPYELMWLGSESLLVKRKYACDSELPFFCV